MPAVMPARACWVTPALLAVPPALGELGAGRTVGRWSLAWSGRARLMPEGQSTLDLSLADGVVPLVATGSLPAELVAAHPQLQGYAALTAPPEVAAQAAELLTGQVLVAGHASGDDPTAAPAVVTAVQHAIVLDELFGEAAQTATLGTTFVDGVPHYRVWAPTAQRVDLLTWPPAAGPAPSPDQADRSAMRRAPDGTWSGVGHVPDERYLYAVTVYAPAAAAVVENLVTDPYSAGLTLGSARSVAVNLDHAAYRPTVWTDTPSPALAQAVDSTIYELHVRDFSIGDHTVPAEHRGTYLAFADDGDGARHLRRLAEAGLNTVHLLPTFDVTSIPEDPADQLEPDDVGCTDLPLLPPDSTAQQACLEAVRSRDGFNWGYDPWHWGVPEGSYATTPAAADGGHRVAEFRTMVSALHRLGLRVVLDQVFNHTPGVGQDPRSVLDRIVPGYYYRLDADGTVFTSTCCPNVAVERVMAGKLVVDLVVRWARDYRVDGFRFDLMGFHPRANLLAVRAALDGLTLARDGVDGRSIYVFGEGWSFGEVAGDARFVQARQGTLGGTGIGTFSDRVRDAARGGGPFDADPRGQGFASGAGTDPNDSGLSSLATLAEATDVIQLGLVGNLRSFMLRTVRGELLRGDQVPFRGAPAAYADEPDEVVTYVDAHDNETLWDALTLSLPRGTSMADRVRMNILALALSALAQTPAFWHAGTDLLRSKSFDRNSYDSGDWFNALSWTGVDNGFGHGLPPAGDNEARWPYVRPLLADRGLKPSAEQCQHAAAMAADLLRLRFSTPLFRLGSAARIVTKASFPAAGTSAAIPGVIAYWLDDLLGDPVDGRYAGVLAVFNARPAGVRQELPGLAGRTLELSPVHLVGADDVVRTATWDLAGGVAYVPARTVAVFVEPRRA